MYRIAMSLFAIALTFSVSAAAQEYYDDFGYYDDAYYDYNFQQPYQLSESEKMSLKHFGQQAHQRAMQLRQQQRLERNSRGNYDEGQSSTGFQPREYHIPRRF